MLVHPPFDDPSTALTEDLIQAAGHALERLRSEISRVIIGQDEAMEQVLIAILCRGHALLEGVPGLAKTLLVSVLARSLHAKFRRIQFTPDLMPADITGTDLLESDESGKRVFRFRPGPLFANLVLADEINRTPPKTQAALLEAMQERSVTVGETTHPLPNPFFVLATRNPIDQEGTYALPEAQLDRFLLQIQMGYPAAAEAEEAIIRFATEGAAPEIFPVLDLPDLLSLQAFVPRVLAGDQVVSLAADLVRASRPAEGAVGPWGGWIQWGAGPRAGIALVFAAKARALMQGRLHATTGDVAAVALPALRHRIIPNFAAETEGVTSDQIVSALLSHFQNRITPV